MPSGAKKRKAAKKKLQKEAHKNGAHHQSGNDDARSHDERDSDGGEVEREPSEEGTVENYEEGAKEVSLGEENAEETAGEVKAEEKLNDVSVEAEDVAGESRNGDASVEHKSSSSSSCSDDDVAVEKEKPVILESGAAEHQGENSPPEVVVSEDTPKPVENVPEVVFSGNSAPSEGVHNSTEESIPVEESLKQVVSLPLESSLVTESVLVESAMASETSEAELKQKVEEVLPASIEKDKISSAVTVLMEETIETKVIQVVERGFENLPEPVDVTARENEALLPQSSGVTAERNGGSDHVKESEKHKYSDEQPLVSSAPLPVRRTSWMNCCGLLEVFSGGSSR
uniref:Uncharacterized protein n=1 Tax=Opuntia streptacantha TaxID=393608 RepID=A0A7C9AR07_OPUST